ncbi:MAG: CotH kinase family protein [Myxococcota bacterium]
MGLKLKGSASYQQMSGKPAFILDFNEWVEGTKFRDLKAIKLHNGVVLDPTRNRDHLSYQLAREAGLMAPRVGWAEVTVNGNPYGLYIIVEKHDDPFIEYHKPGERDIGVVLEPNESRGSGWGWGDFGQGNVTNWDYEEGPIPPDPLTVDALERADQLVAAAPNDANVASFWEVMDKEPFLTYLAWETVVMHNDGYRAPNNWRVFVDGTTHLIQLLPAGVEWTWDANVSAWYSGGAAASWCLQNAGCKREYAEHVLVVADLAEQLDLAGQFADQQVWLDPYIDSDTRYPNTWQSVGDARSSTSTHLADNPGEARRQVYQQYPDLRP